MDNCMSLAEYIDIKYLGNQADFARTQGVAPAQVTQWLKKDFIVVDGKLYSLRRELKAQR